MKNKDITAKKNQLSFFKNLSENKIILALVSGVLIFLSFPQYGFGPIAWISLIPLFFALSKAASLKEGLFLGFLTGIAGYIGIIYWITYVVVNYGYLPVYLGVILMLLLSCYLSIYTALFAAAVVYFRGKILFMLAPAIWVSFEYCKSHLLTGFPWENLGYSQYSNFYIVQFADVLGVYGLSFLIVMVNASLFDGWEKRSKKAIVAAAAAFLILAGIFVYGAMRVRQVEKAIADAAGIQVALIQGNIDQSIKWNENFQKEALNTFENLSLQSHPTEGGLLVWPETALPFNFLNANDLQKQVTSLAVTTKSWFIFGAVSYLPIKGRGDFFNSAYILSPAGENKGRYDKVHLVPYGEYVPLRNIVPFVKGLTAGIGDFTAGDGFYPLLLEGRKIGILICYEGILPDAARTYKRRSAELLVNITNDAWFGATSAPYQHFSMSLFRAVETRLYMVRAANTGVSGIFDPCGRIIAQTKIFEKEALKGEVKFVNIATFYAEYGDILVVICFTLIIIYFLLSWNGRKKWAQKTCRKQ